MPTDQTDSSSNSIVPKLEPLPDAYCSTPESSPDVEVEPPAPSGAPPVVKRKGGRKPIYATSEERKQRNRQAQAAFRERRTEYIKQLEETIKQQETTLQNLQQSHRTAADECLMLRYKNSLLERLLLEKGIDVQAELRMKGGPPVGSGRMSAASPTGQASPMQRAVMNRQQQARVNSHLPGMSRPGPSSNSPSMHTTSSSQHSSPSTGKSPIYGVQGGISPPNSDIGTQQQMQPRPSQAQSAFMHHQGMPRLPPSQTSSYHPPSSSNMQTGFYPSFQKHYDQLEQEYADDAQQADMMDSASGIDADHESSSVHGSGGGQSTHTPSDIDHFPSHTNYPHMAPHQRATGQQAGNSQMPIQSHHLPGQQQQTSGAEQNIFAHPPGHPLFDPFDPMLDADPFGLTASMHFETPFTYDQSQQQGQVGQRR